MSATISPATDRPYVSLATSCLSGCFSRPQYVAFNQPCPPRPEPLESVGRLSARVRAGGSGIEVMPAYEWLLAAPDED
jgi:hypothetical protein